MKNVIIICVICILYNLKLLAPIPTLLPIFREEPIKPFEAISRAVFITETSGDTLAYNSKELATGPFQVRPIRLKDYIKRTGKQITLKDCYDYETSKSIFMYYAAKFGPYETEKAIRAPWSSAYRAG